MQIETNSNISFILKRIRPTLLFVGQVMWNNCQDKSLSTPRSKVFESQGFSPYTLIFSYKKGPVWVKVVRKVKKGCCGRGKPSSATRLIP